jgi:hypothetical protein
VDFFTRTRSRGDIIRCAGSRSESRRGDRGSESPVRTIRPARSISVASMACGIGETRAHQHFIWPNERMGNRSPAAGPPVEGAGSTSRWFSKTLQKKPCGNIARVRSGRKPNHEITGRRPVLKNEPRLAPIIRRIGVHRVREVSSLRWDRIPIGRRVAMTPTLPASRPAVR